jgi:hypothetical protein
MNWRFQIRSFKWFRWKLTELWNIRVWRPFWSAISHIFFFLCIRSTLKLIAYGTVFPYNCSSISIKIVVIKMFRWFFFWQNFVDKKLQKNVTKWRHLRYISLWHFLSTKIFNKMSHLNQIDHLVSKMWHFGYLFFLWLSFADKRQQKNVTKLSHMLQICYITSICRKIVTRFVDNCHEMWQKRSFISIIAFFYFITYFRHLEPKHDNFTGYSK